MRPSRLPWLPFLLACLLAPAAGAEEPAKGEAPPREPLLWEAKGPTTIYLLGTIHVSDERVLDQPDVVEQAMSVSGAVYTELAMDTRTQLAALKAMQVDPEAPALHERLPEPLYARLQAYLESRSMGPLLKTTQRFKVWAVAMLLQTLDLLSETQEKALDSVIYESGASEGKDVAGIETVEEQTGCFDALTEEEQVAYLDSTLDNLEADDAEKEEGEAGAMEELIATYLSGDEAKIAALMDQGFPKDDPVSAKLRKRLLEDRNVHMADRIAAFAAEDPTRTYLLAVGTAHMVGPEGVVELLKKKGYVVRRVKSTDVIAETSTR
jgi:uncharacterized protein YbaP (TraB family)